MKTLAQIKEQWAKENGHTSWDNYFGHNRNNPFQTYNLLNAMDKVAEMYADEMSYHRSLKSIEIASSKVKVNHLCDKCNIEFVIDMSETTDDLTATTQNCPHCEEENHIWIRLDKKSIRLPDNVANI